MARFQPDLPESNIDRIIQQRHYGHYIGNYGKAAGDLNSILHYIRGIPKHFFLKIIS